MENKKKSIEEQYGITGVDGKTFQIPVKGSVALLALGYRGLMAWRAKRIEVNKLKTENRVGKK